MINHGQLLFLIFYSQFQFSLYSVFFSNFYSISIHTVWTLFSFLQITEMLLASIISQWALNTVKCEYNMQFTYICATYLPIIPPKRQNNTK